MASLTDRLFAAFRINTNYYGRWMSSCKSSHVFFLEAIKEKSFLFRKDNLSMLSSSACNVAQHNNSNKKNYRCKDYIVLNYTKQLLQLPGLGKHSYTNTGDFLLARIHILKHFHCKWKLNKKLNKKKSRLSDKLIHSADCALQ